MVELLSGLREKFLGPSDVVFDNGMKMIFQTNAPEATIVLSRGSEVLLDLKRFSPRGTVVKYNPNKEWSAFVRDNVLNKPQEINIGKINGVSSMLDFLHECGHLQNRDLTNNALSAKMHYAENYFYQGLSHPSEERLKALKERNDTFLQSERAAWAYALNVTRKLEKQFGLDIVEKMRGIGGVIQYIDKYIRAYEQTTVTELEYLGFDAYSKKMVVKILGQASGN